MRGVITHVLTVFQTFNVSAQAQPQFRILPRLETRLRAAFSLCIQVRPRSDGTRSQLLTRPLLRLYRIRKAVDPGLPPAVALPVKESAEEKRLKEKVTERDTEIDRLRKEVTSLQDQLREEVTSLQNQMAGQRQAFQVATETIRQDASQREQELKEELAVDVQEHLDRIPRLKARLRANDVVNDQLVLLPIINPALLALVFLLASKMQHLQ
jgi:hypothetical protein